jgi:hypothetical protein
MTNNLPVNTFYKSKMPPRPSDNHLLHSKIPRKQYRSCSLVHRVKNNSLSLSVLENAPVYGPGVCLPCRQDIWVVATHGCRRVTASEWMLMKGFDKGLPTLPWPTLMRCPSIHLWAAIGDKACPYFKCQPFWNSSR